MPYKNGAKQPTGDWLTGETTHLIRAKGETTHLQNKDETTEGETTHGRNDPFSTEKVRQNVFSENIDYGYLFELPEWVSPAGTRYLCVEDIKMYRKISSLNAIPRHNK